MKNVIAIDRMPIITVSGNDEDVDIGEAVELAIVMPSIVLVGDIDGDIGSVELVIDISMILLAEMACCIQIAGLVKVAV